MCSLCRALSPGVCEVYSSSGCAGQGRAGAGLTLMALLTIMMASCRERSVSSMNCSAPPRRMMVHVLALGQPVKKLYLPEGGVCHARAAAGQAVWDRASPAATSPSQSQGTKEEQGRGTQK